MQPNIWMCLVCSHSLQNINCHHHLLRFKAVFHTLLDSSNAIPLPFTRPCPRGQLLTFNQTRVDRHSVLSGLHRQHQSNVYAYVSVSPFRSTCPCHLSLHLVITSPIASTPGVFAVHRLSFFQRYIAHPLDHLHLRPFHL